MQLSESPIEKHMINNTIKDVGQQGKYFYLIMSKPPHPVLHFGMSGWLKYKNEHTYYYQPKEGETECDKSASTPTSIYIGHGDDGGNSKGPT